MKIYKRGIREVTSEEQEKATGNCYIRAFEFMNKLIPDEKENARLVHGKIVGITGSVRDVRFGHAWVEVGDIVYELPKGKRKPRITKKDTYYKTYMVSDTKKYTHQEMYQIGLKNGGNYGPWE